MCVCKGGIAVVTKISTGAAVYSCCHICALRLIWRVSVKLYTWYKVSPSSQAFGCGVTQRKSQPRGVFPLGAQCGHVLLYGRGSRLEDVYTILVSHF